MMFSALLLSGLLAVGEPGDTKKSSDAVQVETPKAPSEGAVPPGSEELEQGISERQGTPTEGQDEQGALKPGEGREARDSTEKDRWERYKKGEGDESEEQGNATRPPHRPKGQVRGNDTADGEWPLVLRRRSPGAAFSLGAFVGFGAGYYYAGEANRALMFTIIDVALVIGFVSTTVAMNQLIIDHDFKTGKSLARDERPMGTREGQLYVSSVIFALAEAGSRIFQGVGAMEAARRTNGVLDGVTFVPMDAGASVGVRFAL
jgi:hypothetical protein